MPNTKKSSVIRIELWHGYIHDKNLVLTDMDKLKLSYLMQLALSSIDYKKLNTVYDLYSIRVTDPRRIVFTNKKIDNKNYINIIDITDTHDYEGIIRSYAESQKQKLSDDENVTIVHLQDITHIEIDDGKNTLMLPYYDHTSFSFYHGNMLALNAEQESLKHLRLPALITGPAGSGKTVSLNAMLKTIIQDIIDTDAVIDKPILVITSKPSLNNTLSKGWYCDANPLSQTQAGSQVLFLSEDEFYQHYAPMARDGYSPITSNAFAELIRTTLNNLCIGSTQQCLSLDNNTLIHEFEIMASAGTLTAYQALGDRESYLTGDLAQERPHLWACYDALNKKLRKDKQYSPHILLWKPSVCFHTALHDEVQTGYRLTKYLIRQMVENGRYLLCGHSAQTTKKKMSDIPAFIKYLGEANKPLLHRELSICYRNPKLVLHFAAFIKKMQRFITNGVMDKTDEAKNSLATDFNVKTRGELAWISTPHLDKHLSANPANAANTVIITRKKYIQDAINKFNTGNVVTVEQFGGQEADHVYLYRLADCNKGNKVSPLLAKFSADVKDHLNLPKADQANHTFNPLFAKFYTGATRASVSLTIVEDDSSKPAQRRRHLTQHFKQIIADLNKNNPHADATPQNVPQQTASSTDADWEKTINTYLEDGQIDVAKQIWLKNLKRPLNEFYTTYHLVEPVKQVAPSKNNSKSKQTRAPRQLKTSAVPSVPTIKYTELTPDEIYHGLLTAQLPITDLCRIIDNTIPLHELLLKDKHRFQTFFDKNLDLLKSLSADDWLRQCPKILYREVSSPYSLLSLILIELCEQTIPPFLIAAIANQNYQLLVNFPINIMFTRCYLAKHYCHPVSIIDLFLAPAHPSKNHLSLVNYYLIKQTKYINNPSIDTLEILNQLRHPQKECVAVKEKTILDASTNIQTFIEQLFSKRDVFKISCKRQPNGLKAYETWLTNNAFTVVLTMLLQNNYKNSTDSNIKIIYANLVKFFLKIDYTELVTLNNIKAPLLFHMLDNLYSRGLLVELSALQGKILIRDDSFNKALLAVLFNPYPSATFAVGNQPKLSSCLELLFKCHSMMAGLGLTLLLQLNGLLKACLIQAPDLLFNTTVTRNGVPLKLLSSLSLLSYPDKPINIFQDIFTQFNGLFFKQAPLDFMSQETGDIFAPCFGHLLFQYDNFDFINDYFNIIKSDTVSAKIFSEQLFHFLFHTKMFTTLGTITTFTALARNEDDHVKLANIINFITPHCPTLNEAIAECLNESLNTTSDYQHFVWNGLATLLSTDYRRNFMVALLLNKPQILKKINSDTWSHPSHPDILLGLLYAFNEGRTLLSLASELNLDLLKRAKVTTVVDTTLVDATALMNAVPYDLFTEESLFTNTSIDLSNQIIRDVKLQGISALVNRTDFFIRLLSSSTTAEGKSVLFIESLFSIENVETALLEYFRVNPNCLRMLFDQVPLMGQYHFETHESHLYIFEAFYTNIYLRQILKIFIETDPDYFFLTHEFVTYLFLMRSANNNQGLHFTNLAIHAPEIFHLFAQYMPHLVTDFHLPLWFRLNNENKVDKSVMTTMIYHHSSTGIFASILALNNYHLLTRLSYAELMEPTLPSHNRIKPQERFSIFEFALACAPTPQDKTFADVLLKRLNEKMNAADWLLVLCKPNFANKYHLGATNLYYFFMNEYFVNAILAILPLLSPEKLKLVFTYLGRTSPAYHESCGAWSPLCVLIYNPSYGIPALSTIFRTYPHFIDEIPLQAWSSPDNHSNYCLLNQLRHNTIDKTLYDYIVGSSVRLQEAHLRILSYDAMQQLFTNPAQALAQNPNTLFGQSTVIETEDMYDLIKFEKTSNQP